MGNANLIPRQCLGDISEGEIEHRSSKALSKIRNMKNCIFKTHCPQINTHIGLAPRFTKDLKPVLTLGGDTEMDHVDSTSIRAAIERNQPIVGLHGHIHEARGSVKIGRTICFNPGSEYATGALKGVVVNLSDNALDNYIMTEG